MPLPKTAGAHQATHDQLIACARWHEAAANTSRAKKRASVHRMLAKELRDTATMRAKLDAAQDVKLAA